MLNIHRSKLDCLVADFMILTSSFCLSIFLRQSSPALATIGRINFNPDSYFFAYLIASLLLLLVFASFRLYEKRSIAFSSRIFTVLKALAVWALVLAGLIFASKSDFSRAIFLATVILTAIFVVVARFFLFRLDLKKSLSSGEELILIGSGNRSAEVEHLIRSVLADINIRKIDRTDRQGLRRLASLPSREIFIADESLSRQEVLSLLADEKINHHSFRVVLDTFRLVTGEIRPNDIDELPLIRPRKEPSAVYLAFKRAFDLIGAALGMVLSAPIWLAVALLIRLDSSGPVLIRQRRIGWRGRPFTLLKFRTMRRSALLYEKAPLKDDDERITRVGRLLRRLSLDELPQLWNVFKGDMSLVGPRPHPVDDFERYQLEHLRRLDVKPGLTGLWQVTARCDPSFERNLALDLQYIENWSLGLDVRILLGTIPVVVRGEGA